MIHRNLATRHAERRCGPRRWLVPVADLCVGPTVLILRPMPILFINADLEISSTECLEPLRDAFAFHGDRFFELYCGETTPGQFLAAFEVHPDGEFSDEADGSRSPGAEVRILAFCDSISELSGIARQQWDNSTSRVIDLGYQSDDACSPLTDRLSAHVLQRMADLGIQLAITIYPRTIRNTVGTSPTMS